MEELTAQMSGVNLSALTGRPVAGDILLYAIPVCGPYEALKDFKFKVKLVPGGDKKGHSTAHSNPLYSILVTPMTHPIFLCSPS